MTFEQYATDHLSIMLRTAQAISGDHDLAEDLVQDVLIKLAGKWDDVRDIESLDAYVRRMLVNEFVSWRRKWSRLVPRADPTTSPVPSVARGDFATSLVERDALLAEILALPARQRMVIGMRYLADLPDAAIADALGCSEVTVRVHASRALAALRVAHRQPDPLAGIEASHEPHRA